MNENYLRRKFKNASKSFILANLDKAGDAGPSSEPKHDTGLKSLEAYKDKETNSKRIILSYSIFRTRQLDPDNCFTKYHTDALRYEHLIKDDRDQDVEIKVRQFKSKLERVEIQLIYP